MLIRMVEEGMPIDDIVFIHVMATPTIGGEFPEMYEYIHRMERYIDPENYHCPVGFGF